MAREKRFCKIEGCNQQLDYRNVSGLCHTHYSQKPLIPQEGRVTILRSYQTTEREKLEPRSIEIQIQEELFPRYRAWILERLLKGRLKVHEAIYGGSMFLKRTWGHGSADTTREWLNELCSEEGEFEVFDPKFENWGPCVRQKTPELEKALKRE
jgi:hypothetical protein